MDTLVNGLVPADETVAELVDACHRSGAWAHLHGASDLHPLARSNETAPVQGIGAVHSK